jgi:hypothetical protein
MKRSRWRRNNRGALLRRGDLRKQQRQNHPAGYALRKHEKNRLLFIFQPTKAHKAVPFDLNTFRYEPFKDTGEIPEKIKPQILTILREAAVGI